MARDPRRSAFSWLAAAVFVLASCDAVPSATPSQSAAAASPQATSSSRPPTPVPSAAGIDPITPTSDHAVVKVVVAGDVGGPSLTAVLYDDGSLLDPRAQPQATIRPLSPSGLALVQQRLRESGLFTTSHAIPPKPVDHGFAVVFVTFVDGDATVTVSASNASDDDASRALVALGEGLMDPIAWLPADAFEQGDSRPHPYHAREVIATSEVVALEKDSWTNAAQSIDRVSWPLAGSPVDLGAPITMEREPGRSLRCGVIDGAAEAAVRTALGGLESDEWGEDQRSSRWYLWLDGPALLQLTLRSFLPDETAACAAPYLPGAPSLAHAPRPTLPAMLELGQNGWTPVQPTPAFFVSMIDPDSGASARVSYYADGTVLFYDPPPPAVVVGARRLAAEGLASIDRALTESELLRASYTEAIPDGASGFRMFTLVTDSVILNGSDRGRDPKASAVVSLVHQLIDPVGWLPPGSWIGDPASVLPFRPGKLQLSIHREGTQFDPSVRPLAALQWPIRASVERFGKTDESWQGIDERARLGSLSAEEALALVRALTVAGAQRQLSPFTAEYRLAAPEPGTLVVFQINVDAGEWGP